MVEWTLDFINVFKVGSNWAGDEGMVGVLVLPLPIPTFPVSKRVKSKARWRLLGAPKSLNPALKSPFPVVALQVYYFLVK